MNMERFITVILVLSIAVVGVFFVIEKDRAYQLTQDKNRNKPFVKMDDVFSEPLTLWWGGLSGTYPRYITEGGLKGMGWEEFPVRNLKENLKKRYGVSIIDWALTPNRLKEEFKNGRRPICLYPYSWKDPEKEFKNPSDFIYSKAIDFSGDEKLSILIRQDERERERFENHLDERGNLILSSLLDDSNLRTNLISGELYDEKIQKFLFQEGNQWFVKKSHARQISLMAASENNQLLSMLEAKRIDYVFSNLVSINEFKVAHPKADFESLVYRENKITDPKDKNLVFWSVQCSKHPLSYQVMPIINDFVSKTRGPWETQTNLEYHFKLDPLFVYNPSVHSSLQFRLLGFGGNAVDWWYSEYGMDKALSEPLAEVATEDSLHQFRPPPPVVASREIEYYVIQDKETLIVLGKTDYLNAFDIDLEKSASADKANLRFMFSKRELDLIISSKPKIQSLRELQMNKISGIRNLSISHGSVPRSLFAWLLQNVAQLASLNLYFLPSEYASLIPSKLSPSITELSLVFMDLSNIDIYSRLKGANLKILNLAGSNVSREDIIRIIGANHHSITSLNLFAMSYVFNQSFVKAFSSRPWPNLKLLNINSSFINGTLSQSMVSTMMPKLEEFYASDSFFTLAQLEKLFKQSRELKIFNPAGSFPSKHDDWILEFPPKLEKLNLVKMRLHDEALLRMRFPPSLDALSLNASTLTLQGIANLNQSLSSPLSHLEISGASLPLAEMKTIFEKNNYLFSPKLKELNIANSRIKDDEFAWITHRAPNLEKLDISNNLLTDQSMTALLDLKNLRSINLPSNYISEKAMTEFFRSSLFQKIETFFIKGTTSFPSAAWSQNPPKSLLFLNMDVPSSSQSQIEILCNLPSTLRSISLMGSRISTQGAACLSSRYFPNLTFIAANSGFDRFEDVVDFTNSLPNSLEALIYHNIVDHKESKNAASIRFPQEINTLRLSNIYGDRNDFLLVQKMPAFISFMQINPTSKTLLEQLSKRARPTLFVGDYFPGVNSIPAATSSIYLQNPDFHGLISMLDLDPVYLGGTLANSSSPRKTLKIRTVKNPRLTNLAAYKFAFNDEDIELILPRLANVRLLILNGSQLTGKGIVKILKSISSDAISLQFKGSKLKFDDLDEVILHFPPYLRALSISEADIGENGRNKLRRWKKEQEKKLGHEVMLEL